MASSHPSTLLSKVRHAGIIPHRCFGLLDHSHCLYTADFAKTVVRRLIQVCMVGIAKARLTARIEKVKQAVMVKHPITAHITANIVGAVVRALLRSGHGGRSRLT